MWKVDIRSYIQRVLGTGELDPLVKEMIYITGCEYCIASHTVGARKKGMTDGMFAELMAVVGMANETNRLAKGYQFEVDEAFQPVEGVEAQSPRRGAPQDKIC